MPDRTFFASFRLPAAAMLALAALAAFPLAASGQTNRSEIRPAVLGERYHIEVGGTLWNPTLVGVISSDRLDIVGDQISFADDLGFTRTRFKDLRLVLRPSQKHRFRFQYTPVLYTADTIFQRDIVFSGQVFPVSVPVSSEFGWTVWRAGYEYDFLYTSRGFVGVLLEGRYTQLTAHLSSPVGQSEVVRAQAPLPAIGLVARAYVLPEVAINFEVSGLTLRRVISDYDARYLDWDLNGTVNLTEHVGLQVGWRKMTTYLQIDRETGDLTFQGLWFGAAVRY
jgi:hypothetical protein